MKDTKIAKEYFAREGGNITNEGKIQKEYISRNGYITREGNIAKGVP